MSLRNESFGRGFRLGAIGAGLALSCLLNGLTQAEAMVEFWQVFKTRYGKADILKFGDSSAVFSGRCNACHTGSNPNPGHTNHNRYKMDVFHGCQTAADGCKNSEGSPFIIPATAVCTAFPHDMPDCLAPPWGVTLDARLAAVEGLDSDGDGWTNKQEIDALTLPGDPNDFPRLGAITARSFVIANETDDEPDDNQHEVITEVLNTPVGSSVAVSPSDATTGAKPVTLTFASVSQAGLTSLTTSNSGPPPAAGFELGSPPVYYELTTTAVYSPPISVCIDYTGIAFADEANLKLFHFEGGVFVDRTVSLDTTANVICASVDSLSPFAVFERADFTAPVTSASASPGPNGFGWNNQASVTLTLSATDEAGGSGVKEIVFTLEGAQTGSVTVSGSGTALEVASEGVTKVTYFARDRAGNDELPKTHLVRIDRTMPVLSGLPAPGCTLWPPNHRLVQVAVVTAADALSGVLPGSLEVTATSSEPEGPSARRSRPDVVIEGGVVWLRAERSGGGDGRVYEIRAEVSDLAGNLTHAAATCSVPHDQRRR